MFTFAVLSLDKPILQLDNSSYLLEDGAFFNLTVTNTIDMWTDDHHLASNKLSIIASGPQSTDQVELLIVSKQLDQHDLVTCIV